MLVTTAADRLKRQSYLEETAVDTEKDKAG